MIILHVADTAGEWREAVMKRDGFMCRAKEHAKLCVGRADHAHHIVYKSQLGRKESYWIVENGIALSDACHTLAHTTHNGILDAKRCRDAVNAVNVSENYKVPMFSNKAVANG